MRLLPGILALVILGCGAMPRSASRSSSAMRLTRMPPHCRTRATTPMTSPSRSSALALRRSSGIDLDDAIALARGCCASLYSGHARQYGGINYLMPVDAALHDEADLRWLARVQRLYLRVRHIQPKDVFEECDRCRRWSSSSGSFTIGSPSSEPERYDDEAQLRVTIAKPFARAFGRIAEQDRRCLYVGGGRRYRVASRAPEPSGTGLASRL
jgi:hypothetical protein